MHLHAYTGRRDRHRGLSDLGGSIIEMQYALQIFMQKKWKNLYTILQFTSRLNACVIRPCSSFLWADSIRLLHLNKVNKTSTETKLDKEERLLGVVFLYWSLQYKCNRNYSIHYAIKQMLYSKLDILCCIINKQKKSNTR